MGALLAPLDPGTLRAANAKGRSQRTDGSERQRNIRCCARARRGPGGSPPRHVHRTGGGVPVRGSCLYARRAGPSRSPCLLACLQQNGRKRSPWAPQLCAGTPARRLAGTTGDWGAYGVWRPLDGARGAFKETSRQAGPPCMGGWAALSPIAARASLYYCIGTTTAELCVGAAHTCCLPPSNPYCASKMSQGLFSSVHRVV